MASTTRWILDSNWATCGFTAANFNSLAAGSCVVASSSVTNSTALDQYAEVSFTLTVGGTTALTSYLELYVLPLNQDGTTYGDGSSSGSTLPAAQYRKTVVNVLPSVASGSAVTGTFPVVVLPPGDFKYVIGNQLGIALNATAAATIKHRTSNVNLNA